MFFLSFFSKTALTIFLILCIELDGMILHHSAKTACQGKIWFSSYGPKRVDQSDGWNPPYQFWNSLGFLHFLQQMEMIQRCFATSQL